MYHTTDADGVTEINPPFERLRELLAAVDAEDDFPDVSLVHDSGWVLAWYPGGTMVFERTDESVPTRLQRGLDLNAAHRLWILLAEEQLQVLAREPWVEVD